MDFLSRHKRSELMSRIPSRGNLTTEKRLATIMRRFGIKGWRTKAEVFGKPDFYFPKSRVAVFVDGDFWHGNPRNFRLPASNQEYWLAKIENNRRRDREVNLFLRKNGIIVLRFWESRLRQEHAIAARLSKYLSVEDRLGKVKPKLPTTLHSPGQTGT
jgi:DNA mismatch endonuclease (patch repair protein)